MFVMINIDKKGGGNVLIRQRVGRRCERVRTRGGWLARRGGEFNGRRGAGIRDHWVLSVIECAVAIVLLVMETFHHYLLRANL